MSKEIENNNENMPLEAALCSIKQAAEYLEAFIAARTVGGDDHGIIKPLHVIVNFDGGSRGNPGPAGAGAVVCDAGDKSILYRGGVFLGKATCNVAEYEALIHGLGAAQHLNASKADIFGDSELVVLQMTGEYRVKSPRLKPLHRRAVQLADGFEGGCSFRHIPREQNAAADRLANDAMDAGADVLDAKN